MVPANVDPVLPLRALKKAFVEPPNIGAAHSAQGKISLNLFNISAGISEICVKSISFKFSFHPL